MKSKELKEMLASRTGLYKSYIKNVRVCEIRYVGHVAGWCEIDYRFNYKGKSYICEQHFSGDKRYSAESEYVLKELHS